MKTSTLSAARTLAIGIVLACGPLTQACSEDTQSAEQIGAAKLKQAQAQAAADKLAKEKAEKAAQEAARLKAEKVAQAKAAEAKKAVDAAKAAQKDAGVAVKSSAASKEEPLKVADASAATKKSAATPAESAPEFTDAFLNDPANITAGQDLWKQCRHCHGAKAYPGKAPKLKPRKYKPSFAYNRITDGYRKMPPWKEVFSQEQRMQLVAYIKSKQFAP